MGNRTRVEGGGAARGVASDFEKALQGINPQMMKQISDMLNGGGAAGDQSIRAMQEAAGKDFGAQNNANYGMNTSSAGSPAAMAAAQYAAHANPAYDMAVSDNHFKNIASALSFLSPAFMQAVGIGIPQAQLVQKPTLGANILNGITGVAGAVAPFFGPAGMAVAGAAKGMTGVVNPGGNVAPQFG